MPRFKHHRSSRGIKPSVKISAIISPEPVNNEFTFNHVAGIDVNRMDVIAEDELPAAFVLNDELFHRSRLYEVTKPVVEAMKSVITDAIATSVGISGVSDLKLKWGKERMSQFLEHLFGRLRSVLQVDSTSARTTESLDTQIVNSAVDFIAALSLTATGGTNFTANDYVRQRVLEALIPMNKISQRMLSKRLQINRLSLPQIILQRKEFNDIQANVESNNRELSIQKDSSSVEGLTVLEDEALRDGNEIFAGDMNPGELALLYLFKAAGLEIEDSFFLEEVDDFDICNEPPKKIKKINAFQNYLKKKKRGKRKDCPNYIGIVRSYAHDTFRIDTFAKDKVFVEDENGNWEYHMKHVQNSSMEQAHKNFLQSEKYKEWQNQNRWIKKSYESNGVLNNTIVLPSICLRLFFYAMCPCCQDPKQQDCADSLVVGFTHALSGIGKIRNRVVGGKKKLIEDCECEFHAREVNKKLWRSTHDFMSAVLCAPITHIDFANPVLSDFTRKV